MNAQELTAALAESKDFFDRSTSCLKEEDSTYSPTEEAYTVAQQVGHVSLVIDWFLEGAFRPEGFDLEFEKHAVDVQKFTSLAAAREAVDRSFAEAIETFGSKSEEVLAEMLNDKMIMPGKPRAAVAEAIAEHTAHHRGALTVYSRLCGREPKMPYMDMEA